MDMDLKGDSSSQLGFPVMLESKLTSEFQMEKNPCVEICAIVCTTMNFGDFRGRFGYRNSVTDCNRTEQIQTAHLFSGFT